MFEGKSFVAVVAARAGSKRLPGKNLRSMAGQPLIGWTLDAALASRTLDHCVVSTDEPRIADFATDRGLVVEALRPAALATDTATSTEVVAHELAALAHKGLRFDYVVLLQPTSPLRTAEHIDAANALACEREADAVVSVCRCEHHPYWSCRLGVDGRVEGFLGGELPRRASQSLPPYFRLNGAIYVVRTDTFARTGSFFAGDKLYSYEMSPDASVDIDTLADFQIAEDRLTALPATDS